jgi:hypothetical protein
MFFEKQINNTILERPFLGMGCITGLYALAVACYNIKQRRTVRTEKVSLAELSDLLKRTDIVIE